MRFSKIADGQLDTLEAGDDPDLYEAVLQACRLVFTEPGRAQDPSSAVMTSDGLVMRLPVVGSRFKVFWRTDFPEGEGARIEAIFPYPRA